MSEFTSFLKSKLFFKNLGIAVVVVALFFGIAVTFLSFYTRHGDFIILPDLTKLQLTKAEELLKDKHLNYVVIDSAYDEKLPPQTILNQNPYAGAHVKSGRNIYLYITTSVPPQVEMPNLVDKSLRQAKGMLANVGLKIGVLYYQADQCVDCVLKQSYKNKTIAPSAMLPKGSRIDLTIGRGLGASADTVN